MLVKGMLECIFKGFDPIWEATAACPITEVRLSMDLFSTLIGEVRVTRPGEIEYNNFGWVSDFISWTRMGRKILIRRDDTLRSGSFVVISNITP